MKVIDLRSLLAGIAANLDDAKEGIVDALRISPGNGQAEPERKARPSSARNLP
jgi:hypothetical protein